MDKGAIVTGLVGGVLLSGTLGAITWVLTLEQTASDAREMAVIQSAIEAALESERERGAIEQGALITRLDAQEAARQEFRTEVRSSINDLRTSQQQMLQALVTMAGGN